MLEDRGRVINVETQTAALPFTLLKNSSHTIGHRGLLAVLLIATAIAAVAGSRGGNSSPEFYGTLVRPLWAPPAWLFGPVWTLLYLMMAVAAWLVVRVPGWNGRRVWFATYGAQLIANALWTWLFFTWRSGAGAMIDVAVLWLLVVGLLVTANQRSQTAVWLLIPYLAWVTFASALSWAVWRLNPALLGA